MLLAFNDRATFDPATKTAISVRDGVLEYLGLEIGATPPDKVFRIYRSPATIANAAMKMAGIPLTDEHVSLDSEAPTDGGTVNAAEMVDAHDATTNTTIAIKNSLTLSDGLLSIVDAGKREMSLGYRAQLIESDVDGYDFEQVDIQPHHLAVVPVGRNGPLCSFIDHNRKRAEDNDMTIDELRELLKSGKVFADDDGSVNLERVAEVAAALPEALKTLTLDKLNEIMPQLMELIENAKVASGDRPAEAPAGEVPAADEEPVEKTEEEKFADAAGFIDAAISKHNEVIDKARLFLDESYVFAGKKTAQIQRDVLASESSEKFADGAELDIAFKMLKASKKYTQFGDQSAASDWTALGEKEI